jgi:hypothetical protein
MESTTEARRHRVEKTKMEKQNEEKKKENV